MNYLQPKTRSRNPEEKTNWFSNLFFCYTRKILTRGYKKELTEDDIYDVLSTYKSKTLGDKIEKVWEKQKIQNKTSIPRLLWKCFGKEYMFLSLTTIISMTITYLQPKLLKKYVSFFAADRSSSSKSQASIYGVSLIAIVFFRFLYSDNFYLRTRTLAYKIRASFTSLIYRKVLKMKSSQVGKVITLITRDVNEFEEALVYVTLLWTDFCRFLVTCYVLYTEIGWLFNILIGIVVISLVVEGYLAYLAGRLKLKTLQKTDARIQLMKEILTGIQVVKFYSWYESFTKKILKLRRKEIQLIHKIYFILFTKFTLSETFVNVAWYILVIATIFFGVETNAGTLVLIMNSIEVVSSFMKYYLSNGLHEAASVITVLTRIGKFLRETDFQTPEKVEEVTEPQITFTDVDVCISQFEIYNNINLKLQGGTTAITGPVGGGKSLLLKIIMKEHEISRGTLLTNGTISYASQEPWLFPSTIKQNILFGSSFDEERYVKVLRICALSEDLLLLRDGDSTIVIDRGANLSRGQQARINLARAVYKDCDIYIFDDCLANLDTFVSDFIFEKCFRHFLKDKIVIFVTQNPRYIKTANHVVVIQKGEVNLKSNLSETLHEVEDDHCGIVATVGKELDENFDDKTNLLQQEENDNDKKIYSEYKHSGKVAFETYKKYVKYAGGVFLFLLVSIMLILTQIAKSAVQKLESKWINIEQNITRMTSTNMTHSENYLSDLAQRRQMYYIFPILLFGVVLLMFIKAYVYCILGAKASIKFHETMFTKVLNASIEFFSRHLVGNIINRFSEDLLFVDEKITYSIFYCLEYLFGTLGVVVLIATVNITFLIPCLIFCIVVLITANFYIKTGRDLKRLDLAVRSPFIGHMNATFEGLPTIRSSKVEKMICDEFDRHQDLYTSTSYIYVCCFKAFEFFIHIYGVIFMAFVVVRYLIFDEGVTVGDVGLVFSQGFLFMFMLQVIFRMWAKLECDFSAVERILDYSQQNQEATDGFLVDNWPSNGKVEYQNVCFSYKKEDGYILHNLNFTVEGSEKVAIVGKTASGKTSLVSIVLRLYKTEGKILIDDVDIATLPLNYLRSQISFVPQEPLLFSGTLRENIDFSGKYTDEEIWDVLRKIRLHKTFTSLETEINNINLNLSVGQKQLICLGRALLRNSKIVILDEITASLDAESEKIVYNIIQEHFINCTVIIVTHNINLATKCDKVLVLDKGNLVELGRPSDLLENKNGIFYKLVEKNL